MKKDLDTSLESPVEEKKGTLDDDAPVKFLKNGKVKLKKGIFNNSKGTPVKVDESALEDDLAGLINQEKIADPNLEDVP